MNSLIAEKGYTASKNPYPGRVAFEVGDPQELKQSDAAFAASVSLLVFNFIPNPAKALREVRRVTEPGGRISAAVWDYGARMKMLRAFWDAAVSLDPSAKMRDENQMPLCRAGELSALWKRGGLEDVHEQPVDISMKFRSFGDFWDPFLLGQGPAGAYVGTMKGERLRALRGGVKQRLPIKTESDPFTLSARVWAVRGTVPGRR